MIKQINIRKREFLFGIIVAAISSAGIANFVEYLINKETHYLYSACILITIVVIACLISLFRLRIARISSKSIVAIKRDGTFPHVFEYQSLANIYHYLDSCIKENEAYKKNWMESFSNFKHELDEDSKKIVERIDQAIPSGYSFLANIDVEPVIPDAVSFIRDAVECEFLDWLSRITLSYYNDEEKKTIPHLDRSDIADYLLQNKVLDLLSRSITDRANFVKINIKKEDLKYIYSVTDNTTGISYERFELLFPIDTRIKRVTEDTLSIKNGLYEIRFKTEMNTGREQLPSGYSELIFKETTSNVDVFAMPLSIEIKLSPLHFVTGLHQKKYNWLNQVSSAFEEHFSFESHLNRIGFDQAKTVMYMLRK